MKHDVQTEKKQWQLVHEVPTYLRWCGACPSHFLKFVLFRRPTKHRNHKDFAMPQRRESADDFCEKIRQIKPYKGKHFNFKLDLESVKVEVGRSEGMSFSKNKRASAFSMTWWRGRCGLGDGSYCIHVLTILWGLPALQCGCHLLSARFTEGWNAILMKAAVAVSK